MANEDRLVQSLIKRHEGYFEEHGDTFLGVGWTRSQDLVNRRHQLMLNVLPDNQSVSVLDIGSGLGHTYDYLQQSGRSGDTYTGIDLSQKFVDICIEKYPGIEFICGSVNDETLDIPAHDYSILSGLFTSRGDASHEEYWEFCKATIASAARLSQRGFVFNATTKFVEWERDDLFHLEIEPLLTFLHENISRHFSVRHDYGLYEFTTYVYHDPQDV